MANDPDVDRFTIAEQVDGIVCFPPGCRSSLVAPILW